VQVWCDDFLGLGNITKPPSCCRKDDEIFYGWCEKPDSKKDGRYEQACNPWHPEFGTINWVTSPTDGSLEKADARRWQDVQDESSFCEVLGKVWLLRRVHSGTGRVVTVHSFFEPFVGSVLPVHCQNVPTKFRRIDRTHVYENRGLLLVQTQREWLNQTLYDAKAPVLLLGSGSVIFGHPDRTNSPTDEPPYTGLCSGDDWDCYRPAQQNLLAMLARNIAETPKCVIIMTGDYHHADIKRIMPGETAKYSQAYMPPVCSHLFCMLSQAQYGILSGQNADCTACMLQGLTRPIWQIMASGMDRSTAQGLDTYCKDSCCGFEKDNAGLRGPGRECRVFGDPNFGMIEFDWLSRIITLTVISGDNGGIAIAADGEALQTQISMDTCEEVQA
jgi:hypothetical protein